MKGDSNVAVYLYKLCYLVLHIFFGSLVLQLYQPLCSKFGTSYTRYFPRICCLW
uniref:Uncharacterized protein n=1 Tax=Rhizophora mucronata TaxID=61149 RepID=A0A2P2NWG7_RHIMU